MPTSSRSLDAFGAETVDLSAGADPLAAAEAFSRGRGVDAVIITASTKSNEPVHQAALMCRKRGRIVLVGVTGLELSRADFYEKELTFQVSCSYGPGRYDPNYEEKGQDYPIGFVRWTEQRNFEAVLDMLADGRLDVKPLISHRFRLEEAEKAYEVVSGSEPSLGILLQYPSATEKPDAELRNRTIRLKPAAPAPRKAVLGFIGAGNYATAVLIPAFAAAGARLKSVASNGGVSGLHAGRKFGFEETTTDVDSLLADPDISAVVVSTRHDSHADYVCKALEARKHVFVEKPLALSIRQLDGYRGGTKRSDRSWLLTDHRCRLQPPLRAPCPEDQDASRRCDGAEGFRHDGQCRRHRQGSLDAGSGSRRRPYRRRGLSFHRSLALSGRRADHCPFRYWAWPRQWATRRRSS